MECLSSSFPSCIEINLDHIQFYTGPRPVSERERGIPARATVKQPGLERRSKLGERPLYEEMAEFDFSPDIDGQDIGTMSRRTQHIGKSNSLESRKAGFFDYRCRTAG